MCERGEIEMEIDRQREIKRERETARVRFFLLNFFVWHNWCIDGSRFAGGLRFWVHFRFWSRRWLSGVCAWASPRSRPAPDLLPDRIVVDRIARLWQLSNNGVQRWCWRLRQLSNDGVKRWCWRPGSVAGVCTKASINRKVHRSPGVNIHCTFPQRGGADHRTDAIHKSVHFKILVGTLLVDSKFSCFDTLFSPLVDFVVKILWQ